MVAGAARRSVLTAVAAVIGTTVLAHPGAAEQPAQEAAQPYIVVLQDSVTAPSDVARQHARDHGAQVTTTYGTALKGYAARLSERARAAVARDPRVSYVEPDGVTQAAGVQKPATWGLDRIDQRALPLDGAYGYGGTGAGVTAYVIDSGMRLTHTEFTGRVVSGLDVVDGGTADDCNGHGTHVAGTLGGTTYGVAKEVQLVAVRVLNCFGSGPDSGVIKAIDWVTAQHQPGKPAVANLSLITKASNAMDQAVRNSIADGISYSVAAGNGRNGTAQDACGYSPGRVSEAMTISATKSSDAKLTYANYGSCVDWFAPGDSITSAAIGSDTATAVKSGTSMAAPHTAGAAALHLQQAPGATPQQVRDALFANSTQGIVTSSNTANNHLLWNGGAPAA